MQATVNFKVFRSSWQTWEAIFAEAAEFASQVGPERLVSISHSEDDNEGVVAVWYWDFETQEIDVDGETLNNDALTDESTDDPTPPSVWRGPQFPSS